MMAGLAVNSQIMRPLPPPPASSHLHHHNNNSSGGRRGRSMGEVGGAGRGMVIGEAFCARSSADEERREEEGGLFYEGGRRDGGLFYDGGGGRGEGGGGEGGLLAAQQSSLLLLAKSRHDISTIKIPNTSITNNTTTVTENKTDYITTTLSAAESDLDSYFSGLCNKPMDLSSGGAGCHHTAAAGLAGQFLGLFWPF